MIFHDNNSDNWIKKSIYKVKMTLLEDLIIFAKLMKLEQRIHTELEKKEAVNALRTLENKNLPIDFCSNDYLGFAQQEINSTAKSGSTGSRLISGEFSELSRVEDQISKLCKSESALIFSSGYTANVGLISSVIKRNDVVLFDQYVHASIREGLQLCNADSQKFKHNDLEDLESKLSKLEASNSIVFIVVESIYSMDGDGPDLEKLVAISNRYNAHLIVDEAHSFGICGENGCGLIADLNLQESVFARIITFGKALGAEGAAVLGNNSLRAYLINFSKPFIYSTGVSPLKVAVLETKLDCLNEIEEKQQYCKLLKQKTIKALEDEFCLTFGTHGNIIGVCIPGNEKVKNASTYLEKQGIDARPILSPTVPMGSERIRICIHAFNTISEIELLINTLLKWKREVIL